MSAYLKSLPSTLSRDGFGTLMQGFKAEKYLGKRLRFSAYVRAEELDDWAGLWMRVDGDGPKMLTFDNMENRPIRGTSDWQRYEIVLDVPQESKYISLGILMGGRGRVWISDVQLEPVDADVPSTGLPIEP